jgi:hypothetical protein
MNCSIPAMAKKSNLSKRLQEISGHADVTDRQPTDLMAALYGMQFRAASRKIPPPRRRLTIATDHETLVPQPVKIVCIGSN